MSSSEKVIEHMKEQLEIYSELTGTVKTKGPGIVLTIYDGEYDIYEDNHQYKIEIKQETTVDNKHIYYFEDKFIKDIKKGNRFIRVDELYQKKIEVIKDEKTFTERY